MLESKETQEPEFDIESLCSCEELYWFNCYQSDNRYKRFVTNESFGHPAKASFGLIDRIYKHLELLELLRKDDIVVDFMAGTGRIPLLASLQGHKVVAVELELHFSEMMTGFECDGETLISQPIHVFQRWLSLRCGLDSPHESHYVFGNKTKAEYVIGRKLDFTVIQGDSRKLSELLEHGGVGVVSPPYLNHDSHEETMKVDPRPGRSYRIGDNYSDDPNNIGNLPDKPSKVGIVSPPYTNVMADQGHDPAKDKVYLEKGIFKNNYNPENKDNIGNLSDKLPDGNLLDKPSLVGFTSPAYEKAHSVGDRRERGTIQEGFIAYALKDGHTYEQTIHSEDPNNLGNSEGESYTEAMQTCYNEAFKAGISPLIIITKNPTRNGALRRLDFSTVAMLQQAGYKIIDYHRSVLFKIAKNATLDGSKEAESYKGRLSFFKRLSLGKGNVAAQFEDILIAVNPNGNFGKVGAVSPPYSDTVKGEGPDIDKTTKRFENHPIMKVFLTPGRLRSHTRSASQYSSNPNNIGNLSDKEEIPT